MRVTVIVAILVVLAIGLASAQPPGNVAIRLRTDAIQGARVAGDTLYIHGLGHLKFPIEYVNRDTVSYNLLNGFIVFSDADGVLDDTYYTHRGDGTATWAHATANGGNVTNVYPLYPEKPKGIWIDTTGFYHNSDFPILFRFGTYGADGSGADTVYFGGAGLFDEFNNPSRAARPLDSGIFFYIDINPTAADTGKWICIDSATNFPPVNNWKWPVFNYVPPYNAYPTWSGAKCFRLAIIDADGDGVADEVDNCVNTPNPGQEDNDHNGIGNACCCAGVVGNVDCDPEDLCDISDLTAFISNIMKETLPCCPAEANIDGSPDGGVDISDLTALIDHLYLTFAPLPSCGH